MTIEHDCVCSPAWQHASDFVNDLSDAKVIEYLREYPESYDPEVNTIAEAREALVEIFYWGIE